LLYALPEMQSEEIQNSGQEEEALTVRQRTKQIDKTVTTPNLSTLNMLWSPCFPSRLQTNSPQNESKGAFSKVTDRKVKNQDSRTAK
jgi:hypothetical protein